MNYEIVALTVSNVSIIYPLVLTYNNNDTYTFYSLLFLGLFSVLSHCIDTFEGNKYFYILNKLDVFGAIIVTLRILFLMNIDMFGNDFPSFIFVATVLCGFMGHYNRYRASKTIWGNKSFYYTHYVFFHSFWHFFVFIFCGLVYSLIIKSQEQN